MCLSQLSFLCLGAIALDRFDLVGVVVCSGFVFNLPTFMVVNMCCLGLTSLKPF